MIAIALPVWLLISWFNATNQLPAQYFHLLWVHSLLEMVGVLVAATIFVVGWQVLDTQRSHIAELLACAALAVAVLNAGHLLSSPEMPAFIALNNPHKEMLFALMANFIVAVALLGFVLMPQEQDELRSSSEYSRFWFLLATVLFLLSVILLIEYRPNWFPTSFTAEAGGSGFKLAVEGLIIGMHGLSLLVIVRRRERIQVNNIAVLMIAIALLAIGGLFAMSFTSVQHPSNIVGHLYSAIAYVYLYRAIFLDSAQLLPLARLRRIYSAMNLFVRRQEDLFENAPDGILTVDGTGCVVRLNTQIEHMFGYSRSELLGQSLERLLPATMRERHAELRSAYMRAPTGRPMALSRGLVGRRKDGSEIPLDISLGKHGGTAGTEITAFIRDVSERREMELAMQHRATHDALTGLPNRALLQDRLDRCLVQATRQKSGCALMMLDLDNFKDINDGWGHSTGDELLVAVAGRIGGTLRQGDTVARFGGDEFVILAVEVGSQEATAAIADKVISALQPVFSIGGHQFHVTASIGVASFPQDARDAETLMSHADIAMYRAKSMGRHAVCYYDEDIGMTMQKALRLKEQLAKALKMETFELYYQPQYSVADGQICSFEALLRWQGPDGEWISPEVFIPLAESSGLIIPLTEWVLRKACQQIRDWAELGFSYRISVNISALHFRQEERLLSLVNQVLTQTGADPHSLGLELTESALMDKPEVVAQVLSELVALGLHVSIDDFGTGYSSLASLQMYPLHTLKIDRSFMRDLHSNAKNAAIVCGLASLARSLGLKVLAEGVETAEQLAILRLCQCDAIQGWFMSPALPAAECEKLLYSAGKTEAVCS
ncbi:MAG: EAL domain-containing protein [Gammaproteobacteria bacterium]|nr:EAL domain-containing protein [Gammaproteobacteria bacterium]